ncbi:MAG: sulfatase family protein [Acidimicrobiales bacterium]
MRRNVLVITADQLRHDALCCTGNPVIRTPHLDAIAAGGIRYERAYVPNVTCTPSRSSLLTGQLPRTHGAWGIGVPLPDDAPSVAAHLKHAGYHTALIGKGHFEPSHDPGLRFNEERLADQDAHGPYRGFDMVTFAGHGPFNGHYGRFLQREYPEWVGTFLNLRQRASHPTKGFGGDTGAPDLVHNPVPTELYHTSWVAQRTVEHLAGLPDDDPWFVWMSFPDPHHPWDPPEEALSRVPWRERPLPEYYPGSRARCEELLAQKPAHWLGFFEGSFRGEASRGDWAAKDLTADQLREIAATVDVEVELIDDAIGTVLAEIARRGWDANTDIIVTADHGDFQGEFGLLFKGAFHCDALMRVPLLWRPAPSAGIAPAVVSTAVPQIDVTATIAAASGTAPPGWMEGELLPTAESMATARPILTTYDSPSPAIGMHLRTIHLDPYTCTVYEPSTIGVATGHLPEVAGYTVARPSSVSYVGTEGELYDLSEDPREWTNRWDDPAMAKVRKELIATLYRDLPPRRAPWPEVVAPA